MILGKLEGLSILFQQDCSIPASIKGYISLEILSLLMSCLSESPSDSKMGIRICMSRSIVGANRYICRSSKAEKASSQAQHCC